MCGMLMSQGQSLSRERESRNYGLHRGRGILMAAAGNPPKTARTCFTIRGLGLCLCPHM